METEALGGGRRASSRTATASRGQEGEGPARLGAAPARARGWVGKAASRARPPAPPRPRLPSSLVAPSGRQRSCCLAMSQPAQKPAASPRPRRAAAAHHTQEVSGAPARAAGLCPGKTPLGSPGRPPLGVAWTALGCLPVRPFPSLEGRGTRRPPHGRWLEVARASPAGLNALGVAKGR